MTTTTAPATPSSAPDPGRPSSTDRRAPELGRADPSGGYRDGTWSPRTRDLAAEVAALVTEVERGGPRVDRVTHHLGDWEPGAAGRVTVGDHVVHLDGYRTQPSGTVTLVGVTGWPRTCLAVVRPGPDPAAAPRPGTVPA
ncbi:DUF5994 family protein [Rhodococcus aerolatus]